MLEFYQTDDSPTDYRTIGEKLEKCENKFLISTLNIIIIILLVITLICWCIIIWGISPSTTTGVTIIGSGITALLFFVNISIHSIYGLRTYLSMQSKKYNCKEANKVPANNLPESLDEYVADPDAQIFNKETYDWISENLPFVKSLLYDNNATICLIYAIFSIVLGLAFIGITCFFNTSTNYKNSLKNKRWPIFYIVLCCIGCIAYGFTSYKYFKLYSDSKDKDEDTNTDE